MRIEFLLNQILVNTEDYPILTKWKMNVEKIMDIEPENFYPVPTGKSTLIYLEPKKNIFKLNSAKYLEQVTNIFSK